MIKQAKGHIITAIVCMCSALFGSCSSAGGMSGAILDCQPEDQFVLCRGSFKSIKGSHQSTLFPVGIDIGEVVFIDLQASSKQGSLRIALPTFESAQANIIVEPGYPSRFTGMTTVAKEGLMLIFESLNGESKGVEYEVRIQKVIAGEAHPSPATATPIASEGTKPTSTSTLQPTPMPTPSVNELLPQIEILETALIENHYGSRHVIGILQNNSAYNFQDITIKIQLRAAEGGLLEEGQAYTSHWRLFAGGKLTFVYYPESDLPQGTSVEAKVEDLVFDAWIQQEEPVDTDIVIHRTVLLGTYREIAITGLLKNPGKQPLEIISLSGVARDSQGALIAEGSYLSSKSFLMPAKETPFRLKLSDIPDGVEPANLELFCMARQAEINPLAPEIVFAGNPRTFIDYSGQFNLVGTILNQSEQYLAAHLVAAVLDADGRVLDVVSDWMNPDYLPPGIELPFNLDYWDLLNDDDQEIPLANLVQDFIILVDPASIYVASEDPKLIVLETTNLDWSFDGYYVIISGEIADDTSSFEEIDIIGTVLGAGGTIIVGTGGYSAKDGNRFETYIAVDKNNFNAGAVDVHLVVWGLSY